MSYYPAPLRPAFGYPELPHRAVLWPQEGDNYREVQPHDDYERRWEDYERSQENQAWQHPGRYGGRGRGRR